MELSKKIVDALNAQFNEEFRSAYLYESMMVDLYHKNFSGFAQWMSKQVDEERQHAAKILQYLNEQGERVFHGALEAPKLTWKSPLDIFKEALTHEKFITKKIHELVFLARAEKDLATEQFLLWFVTEQVEEESSVQSWIDKIELLGNSAVGLYSLDKEASVRV